MHNLLYSDHAGLYNTIAFDRDFAAETDAFVKIYEQINNTRFSADAAVLELFAGPAYHSSYIAKNHTKNSYCIDNSEAMQEIAIDKHHIDSKKYLLGSMPDAISELPKDLKFDLIICPRYSLGLINYAEFVKLFSLLKFHINPGCVLIFECHRIKNLMNGFSDLKIKERINSDKQSSVSCSWPAQEMIWDQDDWVVQMPIELTVLEGDKVKKVNTISRERIYVKSDFVKLLDGCPFFSVCEDIKPEANLFTQSNLIIIKVPHHV